MKAFRINNLIIAADFIEEAREFFIAEAGESLLTDIVEIAVSTELLKDGLKKTIKDLINEELDRRNEWLRMGVPCDLYWPFIIHRFD